MFDIIKYMCYCWRHEKERHTIFVSSGSGCFERTGNPGGSQRVESGRGSPSLWGFPTVCQQVVWVVVGEGSPGAAFSCSGPSLFDSVVALAGRGGGSFDYGSLSGPIEVALCALDPGGGEGFDCSALWDQAFDLDGGSVFEAVGVYAPEAFAQGL